MTVAVLWLVVGIPAIAIALTLLIGRSVISAGFAYLTLVAAFGVMAVFDRASAAFLGAGIALVYAAGRGGTLEGERPDDDAIGVPEVAVSEGEGHVGTSRS